MSPENPLETQTYVIGQEAMQFQVQDPSASPLFFTSLDCGKLVFEAEFYLFSGSGDESKKETNMPDSSLFFYENGTFTVQTFDMALIGQYELRISAHVDGRPSLST